MYLPKFLGKHHFHSYVNLSSQPKMCSVDLMEFGAPETEKVIRSKKKFQEGGK